MLAKDCLLGEIDQKEPNVARQKTSLQLLWSQIAVVAHNLQGLKNTLTTCQRRWRGFAYKTAWKLYLWKHVGFSRKAQLLLWRRMLSISRLQVSVRWLWVFEDIQTTDNNLLKKTSNHKENFFLHYPPCDSFHSEIAIKHSLTSWGTHLTYRNCCGETTTPQRWTTMS